ncbi:MAG: hypothetical protein HQM10_18385 [Candidatus Riflebacteria bacterium]|nr:hypothetical protein [Candidatus Riflebacteria bacterium]
MATSAMKLDLYKLVESLPESSLHKAKEILEKLLTPSEKPMTDERKAEDEQWLAEGRADAVKALSTIEKELSTEELDNYLDSFNAVSRPVKWDSKSKSFILLDKEQ